MTLTLLYIFLAHLALSLPMFVLSPSWGWSYLILGLVVLLDMALTAWIFLAALLKKRIGLGIFLIVSKYSILGIICWKFAQTFKGDLRGGLFSFLSLVVGALIFHKRKMQSESQNQPPAD